MNFFAHETAAERYARSRPYVHPQIVARIAGLTGVARFASALDVACGTGQSTRAVASIAERVTGIDASAAMLAQAEPAPGVQYQVATAESLPFDDGMFDLITVGLAFHWFDEARFLAEARRVLRSGGWLVLYNSAFGGEIVESPAFRAWNREVYLSRYPTPPRGRQPITSEFVAPFGFELVADERGTAVAQMTGEQIAAYLLTQSNVIAAVEQGSESLESVAEWISTGVREFVGDESPVTLRFHVDLHCLRVTDRS